MGGFGAILAVVLSGFLLGGAARWAVPGPDPMPFWLTELIGLLGSTVGGGIAAGLFGAKHVVSSSGHAFATVMLEILVATALVVLYRRFVQRRPLTGPEAHRFPSRGFGIARMRKQLDRLGVDPDSLRGPGAPPPRAASSSAEQVAERLAELAERRDRGELTDEEYQRERDELRRY